MAFAAKSRKRGRAAAHDVAQTWSTRQTGDGRLGSDGCLDRRHRSECSTAAPAARPDSEVGELACCMVVICCANTCISREIALRSSSRPMRRCLTDAQGAPRLLQARESPTSSDASQHSGSWHGCASIHFVRNVKVRVFAAHDQLRYCARVLADHRLGVWVSPACFILSEGAS